MKSNKTKSGKGKSGEKKSKKGSDTHLVEWINRQNIDWICHSLNKKNHRKVTEKYVADSDGLNQNIENMSDTELENIDSLVLPEMDRLANGKKKKD